MSSSKSNPATGPAPVYAVCGSEEFLKQQALQDLIDRILGKADRALSLSEYDGNSASTTLADVLDHVRTLPFLSDRRLVIVRDADPFITRHREALEDYVAAPCPTGTLLLDCRSLPANTRLYKRIAAAGQVLKFDELKAGMVPAWVVERARDIHGVRMDLQTARMLRDLVGDELGLLDGEIRKLALYVGERRQINPADIELLVGHQREEQVWGILTAIAAGNEGQALRVWEDVWQTDKAASARAIGGITYTVRRLLDAKRAQEAGATMQELGKILMCWNDDRRLQAELSAFSTAQVELMLCRLLDADLASKTGKGSVQSAIEAFIVEMCRIRRDRRAVG